MLKNQSNRNMSNDALSGNDFPRLYHELASWFHLLTAPEDYLEEAKFYRKTIVSACNRPPQTLLELGCGGGNNASHLKAHFTMTLVDLSPEMLNISKSLNPECEHIQGDMRNIRLARQFDAVFIHDAISHITTMEDLRSTIETAFSHCKPGGAALFCPDHVRENFQPQTEHGGHDAGERGMRYLAWDWDPDPTDTTYITDFAFLLREGDNIRCEQDRFIMGLFRREDWLRLIAETGFEARSVPLELGDTETGAEDFLGIKPD
jgi:SAM-dependent methyltransferase